MPIIKAIFKDMGEPLVLVVSPVIVYAVIRPGLPEPDAAEALADAMTLAGLPCTWAWVSAWVSGVYATVDTLTA